MKALAILLGCLLVFASGGWAITSWLHGRDTREKNEQLSELVIFLAEAEGLTAAVAEEKDDLLRSLSDSCEAMGRLAARLDMVGAENARLTRIVSNAREQLEGRGTRVEPDSLDTPADTLAVADSVLYPGDMVTGRVEGDPHTVDWMFTAPDAIALDIGAVIRMQMLSAILPDGRLAVWPESLSPNTTLEVERFEYTPTIPQVGFHWPTALKVAGPVAGIAIVIWEIAR